jgi:RHS repeat-associated protein
MNARNELGSTRDGSGTLGYDAVGRRTARTVSSVATSYLHDGRNPVTVNGDFLLSGLGVDERYARISSSSTAEFLADALRSTVALTDGSGAVTANYTYEPYGATTKTGSDDTSFQYTGRENDSSTNLYYYRARYYSPQLGRFISQDPIGFRGGINSYAYVDGDPVDLIDPLGLMGFGGGGAATRAHGVQRVRSNGNQWGTYHDQDQVCTVPGAIGACMNSNPEILSCCQAHDACYTANACNASSWLGNVPGFNMSCQRCNSQAMACIGGATMRPRLHWPYPAHIAGPALPMSR